MRIERFFEEPHMYPTPTHDELQAWLGHSPPPHMIRRDGLINATYTTSRMRHQQQQAEQLMINGLRCLDGTDPTSSIEALEQFSQEATEFLDMMLDSDDDEDFNSYFTTEETE